MTSYHVIFFGMISKQPLPTGGCLYKSNSFQSTLGNDKLLEYSTLPFSKVTVLHGIDSFYKNAFSLIRFRQITEKLTGSQN